MFTICCTDKLYFGQVLIIFNQQSKIKRKKKKQLEKIILFRKFISNFTRNNNRKCKLLVYDVYVFLKFCLK